MKVLDIEPYVILDVYMKEIRSVLEQKQSADIERVQMVAVSIILSDCNTVNTHITWLWSSLNLNH